eukprot:PhF_6_TR31441/c1_g1_i3/m.46129
MQSILLEPAMITEAVMKAGIKKAHLPMYKMVIMAFYSGIYIGFGAMLLFTILTGIDNTGPVKVLGGLCFSVALVYIIMIGSELFTGNCLLVIAVICKRIFVWEMLRDWLVVWCGNFLGCIAMAGMCYGTGIAGYQTNTGLTPFGLKVCELGIKKAHLAMGEVFCRGVLCNMLVCMAVMLAIGSKTPAGKWLGALIPVMMFAASGYEHSIANMFTYSYATMLNCTGFEQQKAWEALFMATFANMVGAVFLGLTYWLLNIHGQSPEELDHVPVVHDAAENTLFPHSADKRLSVSGTSGQPNDQQPNAPYGEVAAVKPVT